MNEPVYLDQWFDSASKTTFTKIGPRVDIRAMRQSALTAVKTLNQEKLDKILSECDSERKRTKLLLQTYTFIVTNGRKNKEHRKHIEFIIGQPTYDVNYQTPETARFSLSTAVAKGDRVAVELTLSQPHCHINKKCLVTGETALHANVSSLDDEILRRLLSDDRIDPSQTDNNGRTALMLYIYRASKRGKIEKSALQGLRTLMRYPKVRQYAYILDSSGESVVSRFIKWYGNESKTMHHSKYVTDVLGILLQNENVVNAAPHTMATAVELSSLDVCEFLLQHSADPNSKFQDGESSLHFAIRLESYGKIKLLLQHKADTSVKYKDYTPLESALAQGCSAHILELLSYNVGMNTVRMYLKETAFEGETLLTCTMRHGVKSWIQYFLKESDPDDITKPDKTGACALELSCKSEHRQKALVTQYGSSILDNDCVKEFRDWYKFTKQFTASIQNGQELIRDSEKEESIRNTIRLSALPNGCSEAKQMTDSVLAVAKDLSAILSETEEYRHFVFEPQLAGSVSERTKTYVPNEADLVCRFLIGRFSNLYEPVTPGIDTFGRGYVEYQKIHERTNIEQRSRNWCKYINPRNKEHNQLISTMLADHFYEALKLSLRKLILRKKCFGYLHLKSDALQIKDKISHLQLLWRGSKYKDMLVYVDLVPAFEVSLPKSMISAPDYRSWQHVHHIIAKSSRHENEAEIAKNMQTRFKVSKAVIERSVIADLPRHIRHGLIVAKAVRIADISCGNDTSFGVSEQFSSEDFITSFMLKNCLFHILPTIHSGVTIDVDLSPASLDMNLSAYAWTDKIYEKLESCLANKPLRAFFSTDEVLTYCAHDCANGNLPCCSKKALALQLCRNIRKWLHQNVPVLEKDYPLLYGSEQSQNIRAMLATI